MGIRLAFIGDTLLGGQAQPVLDRHGYEYALEGLAPLLDGADLVVANLEGPVTRATRPAVKREQERRRYWYRALPESLSALTGVGVGVVSLANNHILDFGVEGLRETIVSLDAAGVAHCGAGLSEAAARAPTVVTVKGCRIGFLSYLQPYRLYEQEVMYASGGRPGPSKLRPDMLQEDFALLADVDLRVALVHWGRTYRPITTRQRSLATTLRSAGADLVIGHHPHIPQRIELAPGCPVIYSLGNGPFGTVGRFAKKGCEPYGLVVTLDFDHTMRSAVMEVRLIAVDNRRLTYRPVPVTQAWGRHFLASLLDDPRWTAAGDGALGVRLKAGA